MHDKARFAGRRLQNIDLFRIWWLVSLANGFAVLYQRNTTPVAVSFLVLSLAIAATIAGVMTVMSGA